MHSIFLFATADFIFNDGQAPGTYEARWKLITDPAYSPPLPAGTYTETTHALS